MAFNINPRGETFVYPCDKCGAEAHQPSIVKCPVCDRRLCENCSRWNFCGEHLMLLNPTEQKRVQKLDKLQRAGFNPFSFIFPALLGFVLFFVFFFIDGLWWVGLVCFFVFPLSGFIYQFTGKRGKVKKVTFELEKIGYQYRNQSMSIPVPNLAIPTQRGESSVNSHSQTTKPQLPNSTCPNCGAFLSGETNFCSYCGGKL